MEETESGASQATQRICCPSCGRAMAKIKMVKEPESAAFIIEIKCRTGGCHKLCQLNYAGGQFSVAVLPTPTAKVG